ncbi:hypothetical protein ANANG_G00302750 [Anguilla anguilla]|uniref:Uncharacterized protein n=1 Tax=Anguilla anguilla TaxID=7936 RepID=A0A9D3RKQ6_ANGAN|nr:hypothetical protein ANANG_G00302750 [Anguilla anguilla]
MEESRQHVSAMSKLELRSLHKTHPAHLVPDAQGEVLGPGAVLEGVESWPLKGLLDGVSVAVRSGQQQIPLSDALKGYFPACAPEPVSQPNWVEGRLFDEATDVVATWVGRVLQRRG